MNRLERWAADGVIDIQMSSVAHREAGAGGLGRSRKANEYLYTLPTMPTSNEMRQREAIERILFPSGARTENERNDVRVVSEALKWNAILVTADGGSRRQPGGILGNHVALQELGVTVMSDSQAVSSIERKVAERDHLAKLHSKRTGQALPSWVGSD